MNQKKSHHPIKTILIIAPAWIGDMVMAQTLFNYLKTVHPDVMIDVLAPNWTLPLVARMPEIRTGILMPLGHGELGILKRYALGKLLRKNKYDQVIVLPRSFKSALVALWTKTSVRTGWVGECRFGLLNDIRSLDRKKMPRLIQQFVALGLDKNQKLPNQLDNYYPKLWVDQNKREAALQKLQLNTDRPILALCPGAEYGPAKRWPAHNFGAIANQMLSKGWQVWIFGSKKDSELANEILAVTHNKCVDLTGKTSLIEAIDLLSLVSGVISNDSGLMHIAAALQRDMVVIYGSSTPEFTPPLTKRVKIVNLKLNCSPCFKRVCPLTHFDCMNKISPERVISELNSLVNYDQHTHC